MSILAVCAFGLFTPRWETNDDPTMSLIAAGRVFIDHPDEHVLLINVLIGLPLRWLYGLVPSLPWYGLAQIVTMLAAAAGIAYALLRVNPSFRQAVVVFLFFGVGVLPCFAEMQFTKTGYLASLAGLLLFLAPLRGAAPWPRVADAAAVGLLLMGSLVRFESLFMAGAMAAPVALAAAAADPLRAVRRAVPVGLAVAVALAFSLFNRAYYAGDPDWKDYYEYYQVRSLFTDYQRYLFTPESEAAYRDAGWEKIDFDMLMTWFFADRDRYSLEKLREIAATARPSPRPTIRSGVEWAGRAVVEAPVLQQLALAALCVASFTGSGWRRFVLPVVLFGLAFALTVYFRTYYWSPPRVVVPLFSAVVAYSALRPGPTRPGGQPDSVAAGVPGSVALAVCAVILVLRTLGGLADADADRLQRHREAARLVRQLNPRPDQLYLLWREQFPLEDLVTPLGDAAAMGRIQCLALGTLLETPFTERRLRKFGIDDVYRALWERPDVFLVTHKDLQDYLRRYVLLHYGTELEFVVTFHAAGEPGLLIVQARQRRVGEHKDHG
jgi:hypothetical protein